MKQPKWESQPISMVEPRGALHAFMQFMHSARGRMEFPWPKKPQPVAAGMIQGLGLLI